MRLKIIFLLFILNFITGCSYLDQSLDQQHKITGPEVDKFVTRMVKTYNFDYYYLNNLLRNANYQPKVIAAISKPAEKLPWYRYEKIFLTQQRVDEGVEFWRQNKEFFKRASLQYHVPPEIIVSLIGVETFYGRIKGGYPVLDSLATLAFHYKPRSKFFTAELEQFLLYAREEGRDPNSFYGSYAGAMGYPQFISSSIRTYAVDFTNNGQRDLHNHPGDAIGSVANYLNKKGWQEKQPIVAPATFSPTKLSSKQTEELNKIIDDLKPSITIKQLKQLGVKTKAQYHDNMLTSLLKFELESINNKNQNNLQYQLGFNNFYVITRYNNSQNYALVVYLLSEKIKREYNLKYKFKYAS